MMVFSVRIEHALDVAVQCLHDADARRIFPEQLYGSVIAADDLSERVKQMSIIPNLAMLGLAAALSSPMRHHQIDFKMSSPDGVERINQLWLVTYINEAGLETVAQAKLVTGEYAPLIAADTARLESMMPAAHGLAKANNLKMRLIKLTNRIDIEDIVP
jgi:hypothetical protein